MSLPPDLETSKIRLVEQLQHDKFDVDIMTLEDIDDPGDPVQTKFAGSQLFIQPYSYARVRLPYVEGGHLSIPQTLIGDRIQTLWWRIQGEPGIIESETDPRADIRPEHRPEHLQYLRGLDKRTQRGTVEELAQQVRKRLSPVSSYPGAKIWIESSSNDNDQRVQRKLEDLLEQRWDETFGTTSCHLDCQPLPWETLRQHGLNWIRKCHGIILLYGMKSLDSLEVQRDTIEAELETVHWRPGKAVALIPPQKYAGDILWFTFECRLEKDNYPMVREVDLQYLLEKVHDAAVPPT